MKTTTSHTLPIILVSREINLYGLNPYEFRLYAHIAHRGECYSKLETVAIICKMSVRKAQYSLKTLCDLRLIKKTKRKRTTDVYVLESKDNWKQPEDLAPLEKEDTKVKTSQPIFVHAVLDLYGLNPYEFRIYAHIAACGGFCESSLEEIKTICKMSVRKAQYSLKTLCDLGLIKKLKQKDKRSLYVLEARNNWKQPEYLPELEAERKKVKESLLSLKPATEISNPDKD